MRWESMFLIWIQFGVAAGAIVFLGWRLSICGDIIAKKTGLGHVWVGALLMAGATTLPEMVTSLSAVIVEKSPDMAMGNVLGSIFFNLFIIAILDAVEGKGPILKRVSSGLILSAGISITLLMLTILGLCRIIEIEILSVSVTSLIIGLFVVTGMKLIFNFESRSVPESEETQQNENKKQALNHPDYENISLKRTVITYFILAGLIFFVGIKLTGLAGEIAHKTVLSTTFVGTLFLAAATSLPELAVTVSAVRRGLFDMAISNIFGANIYNIFIIFLADICYRQGSFFSAVDARAHMLIAVLAVISSITVVIGLIYRSKKSCMRLGWDTILMTIIYILGIAGIFYR